MKDLMAEAEANDRAASLVGVPDEDIAARHAFFDAAARELSEQAEEHDPELGRKAYQLLVEMHARGSPSPAHIELPSLFWEIKLHDRVCSVAVEVRPTQWLCCLNGARVDGRKFCYNLPIQGTPRDVADHLVRTFTQNFGEPALGELAPRLLSEED